MVHLIGNKFAVSDTCGLQLLHLLGKPFLKPYGVFETVVRYFCRLRRCMPLSFTFGLTS